MKLTKNQYRRLRELKEKLRRAVIARGDLSKSALPSNYECSLYYQILIILKGTMDDYTKKK